MIIKGENPNQSIKWYQLSGLVNEENRGPKVTWQVKAAAGMIGENVSKKELRELHKTHWLIDVFFIILALGLFIGGWILLANLSFGIIWLLLSFCQVLVINNFFYTIRHDTFHHRQLGGPKLSYLFGVLFSLPMLNSYTRFLKHADHHVHAGYDLFEEHFAELDTPFKRGIATTFPGLVLLFAGKLKTSGTPYPNEGWQDPLVYQKAKRIEGFFHLIWFLIIVVTSFFWPYEVLLAYLIPLVVFGPIIASLKTALQHTESDTSNPLHVAVFLKCNLILRICYCNSVGDMHIVHHIYPRIPFWKCAEAARLMRPTLRQYNVPERTLLEVLLGYYIQGKPYRKPWK